MTDITMSRDELLYWIREDLERAYTDAEQRLSDATYTIHDGLFTKVEVKAYSRDGQKIGKFYKVGDAINLRVWEVEDD